MPAVDAEERSADFGRRIEQARDLVETGMPFDRYLSDSDTWRTRPTWQTRVATLYQRELGLPPSND